MLNYDMWLLLVDAQSNGWRSFRCPVVPLLSQDASARFGLPKRIHVQKCITVLLNFVNAKFLDFLKQNGVKHTTRIIVTTK